jgi:acetyl/propionyl-CoA carboxylase alpha subunit
VEELMRHSFTIADTEHELWLENAAGGYRMHVADRSLPVGLEGRTDARVLYVGEEWVDVAVAVDGDLVHIHLDGGTYTVRYTDPVARHARHGAGASDDLIEAPMPGVVIAVHAAQGRAVARGDTLVVIESMKLETAIKAPRDGVIATLHVMVGKTFDRAAPLVTLAPQAGA